MNSSLDVDKIELYSTEDFVAHHVPANNNAIWIEYKAGHVILFRMFGHENPRPGQVSGLCIAFQDAYDSGVYRGKEAVRHPIIKALGLKK